MAFWIAMLVAVALIYSGFSWLKPSPMEKRQMECRQAARKMGLVPAVRSLSDWAKERHESPMVPFYSLAGGVSGEHFSIWKSGDQWVGQADYPNSHRMADQMHSWLSQAPAHILGVDGNASQIGVWWDHEQAEQLAPLKAWLKTCPQRQEIAK